MFKTLSTSIVQLVSVLSISVLYSCSHYETDYSTGYSKDKFAQIKPGMTEFQVTSLLGLPYEVTTHVVSLDHGGSNNFDGRLNPAKLGKGKKVSHYTLCYSRRRHPSVDFEVCNVFISVDGRVIGKDKYYTE